MNMAITKSAKKEIRSSSNKRVFNLRRLRKVRSSIKDFNEAVKDRDPNATKEKMSVLQKAIDKAVKRGVIKQKTAARKKSRLVTLAKKSFQGN